MLMRQLLRKQSDHLELYGIKCADLCDMLNDGHGLRSMGR
jgi:hypothetical protein